MTFNLNFFFVLLKYILNVVIYIFLFDDIWVKLFALCVTFVFIYILKTYPKKRFRRLSQLRAYKAKNTFFLKYRLSTPWDHVWNIIVLGSFVVIFIIGFLLLRYFNMEKDIDLVHIYQILENVIVSMPIYANILNVILLINIFLIYILSFKKVLSFYRFHIMKRHFYLINFEPINFYTDLIYFTLWRPAAKIYDLINKPSQIFVEKICAKYLKKNPESYEKIFSYQTRFAKYISELYYNIHYHILIFVLLYDLYFNNFHLMYVYKILPFVFIYDLFRKLCLFGRGLDSSLDEILKKIIYHYEDIKYNDNEYFYFGESDFDTIPIKKLGIAVNVYMESNFDRNAVERYERKHQNL